MAGKIIVMFPTWPEASDFVLAHGEKYETVKAGVGLAECAARTAKVIAERRPDTLILAGFAGVYGRSADGPLGGGKVQGSGDRPQNSGVAVSGLRKGDVVLVERENSFDLGSLQGGTFRPLAKSGGDPPLNFYPCPSPLPLVFTRVTSNTVNIASAGHGNGLLPDAEIENMEGAAFFAVCGALHVRCAEIRVVSNIVGEPTSQWIMAEAAARLAEGVSRFIDTL